MELNKINDSQTIPEPTLRRLPWYLAYLKLEADKGESYVSSTQIARAINVSASQIAKDLSLVNVSGKTRVGYDVNELVDVLENFLGFRSAHRAFLFGVGSLGGALLQDRGLSQYGMEIVAGFDVNPDVIGTEINGLPVFSVGEFAQKQAEMDISIGVLTVPVDQAQKVADKMVEGGIRAIWNFTPFRISVPNHIVVQNTSIYAHLAVMFNRLENQEALTKK
ncbi:MAG: redox-sensing transcriptional repressor Rex [Bacteroidales bacterium]|nr:redox-sensing transcriptional repressor Rex [Bacteroidales bacterium]MEA4840763.1 redox-sensing transcriptional repressor Rex [Bacteroidales bacterium]